MTRKFQFTATIEVEDQEVTLKDVNDILADDLYIDDSKFKGDVKRIKIDEVTELWD